MTAELTNNFTSLNSNASGYQKELRNDELQLLTKMMNHQLHNNSQLVNLLDFTTPNGTMEFTIEADDGVIYKFVASSYESSTTYATIGTSGINVLSNEFDLYENMLSRFNTDNLDYLNYLGFSKFEN